MPASCQAFPQPLRNPPPSRFCTSASGNGTQGVLLISVHYRRTQDWRRVGGKGRGGLTFGLLSPSPPMPFQPACLQKSLFLPPTAAATESQIKLLDFFHVEEANAIPMRWMRPPPPSLGVDNEGHGGGETSRDRGEVVQHASGVTVKAPLPVRLLSNAHH